jgi:phage FluMu gp28-like protein
VFDPARKGSDETGIVVIEQRPFATGNDSLYVVHLEANHYDDLTLLMKRVQYLHHHFNFKRIIIDETGLGSPVVDTLKTLIPGSIIEGIVFTSTSKPEMFYNLKLLFQQGKLKLPNHLFTHHAISKKLYYQLLSIRQDVGDKGIERTRIYHEEREHDDLVCALALAAMYFKGGRIRRPVGIAGGRKSDNRFFI